MVNLNIVVLSLMIVINFINYQFDMENNVDEMKINYWLVNQAKTIPGRSKYAQNLVAIDK